MERKKYQRAALDLQDSHEEAIEEEIKTQIEQLLSAKNIHSAPAAAILGSGGLSAGADKMQIKIFWQLLDSTM